MTHARHAFALGATLAAALAALPLAAQPAANANPNAFKKQELSPQCQQLRDDYLEAQRAPQGARGDARDDGERGREHDGEARRLRQEFEQRCGTPPPEMTAPAGGERREPAAEDPCAPEHKARSLAEQMERDRACEKQRREAKADARTSAPANAGAGAPVGPVGATASAAGATAGAKVEPLPRKAGPAPGTGYDDARCTQLHRSMKDALARKDACGKDKACKQQAEFGYEQVRNAYRSGCGEIPDDAKPRKKG